MNGNTSEWLSSVEGLDVVHDRLKRVLIENKDALSLLKSEDTNNTFFYLDPPYLPQARAATKVYNYEMSEAEHTLMLEQIIHLKGKVMLSGYPSQLYATHLSHWRKEEFDIANHASGSSTKGRKRETLWLNY
jgi:DNA adenine methylase